MDDPKIEKSCFLIFDNFWRKSFFHGHTMPAAPENLKIAQINLICMEGWGSMLRKNLKSETKLKIGINDFGPETTRIA